MKAKKHVATLRLSQAVDLLHRADTRLMQMHGRDGSNEFYLVPGGRLARDDAMKIRERPDIKACNDSLFPGCSRPWHMSR
jgi:hypothetical protein